MNSFVLWVAQGFGIGRIPFAPGTWGSVLGLGWFALLLATGNLWIFTLGTILGLAASVWFCGRAEKILNQVDPPSVVLDEVTAMPVCFLTWINIVERGDFGFLPPLSGFFSWKNLPMTFLVFALFRIFDIFKPWPVKQSQKLPGGWGVTVDDFLAAIYVNVSFAALLIAGVHVFSTVR
jgi:phosphatidylglycerophosphatase A